MKEKIFGSLAGAVIWLALTLVGSGLFILFLWWLSNVFFDAGLWPLGMIARILAWFAAAGLILALLALVGAGFVWGRTSLFRQGRNNSSY